MFNIQRIVAGMEKALNKFSNIFAYFISLKYQLTYRYGSKKWRNAFYEALNISNTQDYNEKLINGIAIMFKRNSDNGENDQKDYF